MGRWWGALPFAAMVAVECLDTGLTTISKAAMSRGMSRFIFVLYSNALATLILFPLSFLQRKKRPPLTFSLLGRFFLIGLTGTTIVQNCVATGINYSSPTLGSAMSNLIPAFIFIIAVVFRLEEFDIKSSSSQAKLIGTLVSISGALVVTLFKGPAIWNSSRSPHLHKGIHLSQQSLHNPLKAENWVLGAFFITLACLSSSVWYTFQAVTLKVYPAEMTIVAFSCLFGTIQCAIISLFAERDRSAWILKMNIEIASILYSAVIGCAFTFSVLAWCTTKKGPIFVAMFKPLGIAIAAIMSSVFLGDVLHVGSVIGAVIIVIGFYGVMWGSSEEQHPKHNEVKDSSEHSSSLRCPLLK